MNNSHDPQADNARFANVYDGCGRPLRPDAPRFDGPAGIMATMPCSDFLYDVEKVSEFPESADYIWMVDPDLARIELSPEFLAILVGALDNGGVIALHGCTPLHVAAAKVYLLMLSGGAHA